MSDGSVICQDFLSECCPETDPIFEAWDKQTGITIYWSQIIDPQSGDSGCLACTELTTQDIINIHNLSGTNTGDQNLECGDVLHNDLGGLQGGNGIDEFYHLTAAEHAFVEDIVTNGSGVLVSHTELTDIGTNTHPQIDAHIADTTIHFTAGDVVAAEADPIFTAERDALTENFLPIRGATTLIDSPISVVSSEILISGDRIIIVDGNNNTSIGDGAGEGYDIASNNIAIGIDAGRYIYDGVSDNLFSTNSIYIGKNTEPTQNNNTNEIIIGNTTTGHGSNTTTIGNENIIGTYLNGIVYSDKIQFNGSYVYDDGSDNLTFYDPTVGVEVTLTELLETADYQSWKVSVNSETAQVVPSNGTVDFTGTGPVVVTRDALNVDITLETTGVTPNTYASPNLVIDEYGRITAAEDAAGCQQTVADLGTQSGVTDAVTLDLDNFPNAIISLTSGTTTTITLDSLVQGDTGHIEVTHGGVETLKFAGSMPIHIANNSRLDTNTVKLSPFATIDVVAYWVAKTKVHMAVIFDSIN